MSYPVFSVHHSGCILHWLTNQQRNVVHATADVSCPLKAMSGGFDSGIYTLTKRLPHFILIHQTRQTNPTHTNTLHACVHTHPPHWCTLTTQVCMHAQTLQACSLTDLGKRQPHKEKRDMQGREGAGERKRERERDSWVLHALSPVNHKGLHQGWGRLS